jgi:hypothetical protein
MQALVPPNGLAADAFCELPARAGQHADIFVWQQSRVWERVLKKPLQVRGRVIEAYEAVLGDRGYQGIQHQIGEEAALTMRKKPPGGELSQDDQDFNDSVRPDWLMFIVVLTNYSIIHHPLRAARGAVSRPGEVKCFLKELSRAPTRSRQTHPHGNLLYGPYRIYYTRSLGFRGGSLARTETTSHNEPHY